MSPWTTHREPEPGDRRYRGHTNGDGDPHACWHGAYGHGHLHLQRSNLATVSLVGGVATYSTSSLAVGTNTLGCVYSGDNNYASTNCQAVSETVGSGTTPASIALVSSANPADPYHDRLHRDSDQQR